MIIDAVLKLVSNNLFLGVLIFIKYTKSPIKEGPIQCNFTHIVS